MYIDFVYHKMDDNPIISYINDDEDINSMIEYREDNVANADNYIRRNVRFRDIHDVIIDKVTIVDDFNETHRLLVYINRWFKTKNIIVAGGSMRSFADRCINHIMDTRVSNDIDVYIRAKTANDAKHTLSEFLKEVKPIGVYVRSKWCLSIQVYETHIPSIFIDSVRHTKVPFIYKVQIILDVVSETYDIRNDIRKLINGYDIDCCKIATDGKDIYMTKDSFRCIFIDRICNIHKNIVSYPTIRRIIKYALCKYIFKFVDFHVDKECKAILMINRKSCDDDIAQSEYNIASDVINNMDDMYNQFCSKRKLADMICGNAKNVLYTIDNNIQDIKYLNNWAIDSMSKFVESIGSNVIQEYIHQSCIPYELSINAFKDAMSNILLTDMFSTHIDRVMMSEEEFEKYWSV